MVDVSILQFPWSLILALAMLSGLFLLWKCLPGCRGRRMLSGRAFAIASIAVVAVLTAVEGTWGTPLHRSPFFWAAAVLLMLSLSFATLDGLGASSRAGWKSTGSARPVSCGSQLKPAAPKPLQHLAGVASHLGMFLVVFGAFWSAPDFVDARLIVGKESAGSVAVSHDGRAVQLPFSVRLEEFRTDYYPDGASPKQFSSTLEVDGRSKTTSVNHPCSVRGYLIYQADYDHEAGSFSVLKLVRDPWLPLIFAGMLLLAAGALLRLRLDWKSPLLFVVMAVVAVLFAVLSLARINFGTLMPALRSWWFVPHLILYMLAYSALALAAVIGIVALFGQTGGSLRLRSELVACAPETRDNVAAGHRSAPQALRSLSYRLLDTASSLLLLGMICGAVWAKVAWGDWWTWDAKECWAAVTWLLTLVGTHLPLRMKRRDIAVLVFILLSFAAMQVAWYGVEALPASSVSMHAYK